MQLGIHVSRLIVFAVAYVSIAGYSALSLAEGNAKHYQRVPIRQDLMTRREMLYSHWLRPLVASENPDDWGWVKEFISKTGSWAAAYVDADKIKQATLDGCPIDGQPPLKPVLDIVSDCADRLGVPPPRVVVRSDAAPKSYVVRVGGKHHLVLSSGLLDLYSATPEELRFVVGRELGFIKGDCLRIREVAFGLMVLLTAIDESEVPDVAKQAVLTLSFGRFLTWSREAEISADRAGLWCCESPEIAEAALIRMLHGLKQDSPWIDPKAPKFDARAIVADFRAWEKEPIVRVVSYFQRQTAHTPYVVERIAALREFVAAGEFRELRDASKISSRRVLLNLTKVELDGLAPAGQGVYAYVKVFVGDKVVLVTTASRYGSSAVFGEFRTSLINNGPLEAIYFEVWSDNTFTDELLGGFAIFPDNVEAVDPKIFSQTHNANNIWDWASPSSNTHRGLATVHLKVVPISADE